MFTKHVFDQQIGVKAPSNVPILSLHMSVSDFREKNSVINVKYSRGKENLWFTENANLHVSES